MAHFGGFFEPQQTNLTDLYQFVQSGYDAGKARAQNERLAQLSQAAYNDTGDAQKADISQAIGIDPATGYKLADITQQQNAAALQRKQAVLAKFGKAASAILQAKRSGNDAAAEGIYQSILPDLRAFSAQNGGPEPPPDVEGGDMGAMYKLATMYGDGIPGPEKLQGFGPGTAIYRGDQQVGVVPFKPAAPVLNNGYQLTLGPDGKYTASQVPIGAQNGMGVDQAASGAPAGAQKVSFNFAPGTPPEVIAAAKAAAQANGDLPPT